MKLVDYLVYKPFLIFDSTTMNSQNWAWNLAVARSCHVWHTCVAWGVMRAKKRGSLICIKKESGSVHTAPATICYKNSLLPVQEENNNIILRFRVETFNLSLYFILDTGVLLCLWECWLSNIEWCLCYLQQSFKCYCAITVFKHSYGLVAANMVRRNVLLLG